MMFHSKHAWLLFSVLSASQPVLVPGRVNVPNGSEAATMQADGTERPPLPIPWSLTTGPSVQARVTAERQQPVLIADGTERPPLPIPWLQSTTAEIGIG